MDFAEFVNMMAVKNEGECDEEVLNGDRVRVS